MTLEKHFDFKNREEVLSRLWEGAGVFKPEAATNQKAPIFSICMPPPNANGELHLGHAYGYTVMDILGRFHRLQGERVMLLPGKDHAGIQTQVVFEKKLKADKVDARTLSSAELHERCYSFCTDRARYMRKQEKRLGLSADWSRELFTLDPRLTDVIYDTFERMWKDGLIYKGPRIVNWSVFSQTAISDVEVEYKEHDGTLSFIAYPWVEAPKELPDATLTLGGGRTVRCGELGMIVATTRPETMLGDTALVVHPDDERYKSFIGREVIVPICNRKIRIYADKRIDPAFGTGVVKVTPAHDFLDYDIGQTHQLEMIQVIGKDGRMTAEAGSRFAGMLAAECQALLLEELRASGALLDHSPYRHKVPIGERGKDIIEPLISEQWFVNVDKPGASLKGRALELLRSGKIKIHPERFQVLFEQWLENLRDWNISRQLWWGHRLPVWYKDVGGKQEIHVGRTAPKGDGWVAETDTFDTWFSSGQWAFSTLAAHNLVDLSKMPASGEWFPSHTMVMGRDILFFWACRMLLLTAYRCGDVPWNNIFFTGLIRDEHGQKMSKSKGNGVEPQEMIEKYGTDALRLALVMGATPGNDINMSARKIEGYSKFINKIWNAAKLIEMKLGTGEGIPATWTAPLTHEVSRWIMSTLAKLQEHVGAKLQGYDISVAADELYAFTWTVYCDWYLEMMKIVLERGTPEEMKEIQWVTRESFRTLLTMLHPYMPFLTEELYQALPAIHDKGAPLLAARAWQMAPVTYARPECNIPKVQAIVSAIRSVKATLSLSHQRTRAALAEPLSRDLVVLVQELCRVDLCSEADIPPEKALRKSYLGGSVVCEVDDKEGYRKRLEKDLDTARASVLNIEKKLGGDFVRHAKPELVEQERQRLEDTRRSVTELETELSDNR